MGRRGPKTRFGKEESKRAVSLQKDGMKNGEIATALGCSPSTVTSLLKMGGVKRSRGRPPNC